LLLLLLFILIKTEPVIPSAPVPAAIATGVFRMDESNIIDFQKFGTKQNKTDHVIIIMQKKQRAWMLMSIKYHSLQYSISLVKDWTGELYRCGGLCHSRNSYIDLHDFGGTVV